MKLETRITLLIIISLALVGFILFVTGISIFDLFSPSPGENGSFTKVLFLLIFIAIFSLIILFVDRQIRKPLIYFIRWIDQLSTGLFKRPEKVRNFHEKKIKLKPFIELNSKLDHLTYYLNKADQEQKELEETRRNWTAGVTHDLKTPLSYIKGYAAMLHSDHQWSEGELKEFAEIIEEKSLYMEQLIDDLSVVYEFEQMQIPINLETVDMSLFIKNVLNDFKQYPLAKNYHIELDIKSENILLTIDQTLLKRALENFIMNAVHHNPKGTTIILSIEEQEKAAIIEVKDNGIGMDEKSIQQLFNQYYRGTTTDFKHLGSGLGMSIAKQFIEKQGGQIKVESKQNEGTKIIILFPKKN